MIDTEALKRSIPLATVIRSYGIELKKQGSKLFAHCPFHNDSTPSFSLYRKDGRERAGCKGCDWDGDAIDFIQRQEGIGFTAAAERLSEIAGGTMPESKTESKKQKRETKPGKTIATYDYTDASGNLIFQVLRRQTLDKATGEVLNEKHFSQRRPDDTGGWLWNLQGVTRVLYRLARVLEADTVWIVEGEKDVHSLEACGAVATTNAGGAKAAWEPQYTEALRGKHIIICGDSDQPGRERDATIAALLHGEAASIRMVPLPEGVCKDVTDWFEAGQDLQALLELAAPYNPPAAEPPPPEPEPERPRVTVEDDSGPRYYGWDNGFPITDVHGNPKHVFANALYALRAAPQWKDVIHFNEFSVRAVARNETPWGVGGRGDHAWTDNDDRLTAEWLQVHGVQVSPKTAGEAVATVAREHCYHPVRQYLDILQWDSTPRLDTWLTTYLGVSPSNYSAAVGARWLISAVARVLRPGCKADYALIIEGEQGTRKSSALRALFDPWFTDEIADLGSKDSAVQLQGVWCIEVAELDSMARAEVSKIKGFMSRQVDRFRPPYGFRAEDFPRQNVFAGTVNLPEWMRDPTGGRRFWPVKASIVALDQIVEDRDQIWAEAFLRFRDGERWYLEDVQLEADAREEQMERYEGDAWDPLILEWIQEPSTGYDEKGHSLGTLTSTRGRVTIVDILTHCIRKRQDMWSQADKNRVQRCLTAAGYTRHRARSGEIRQWVYVAPSRNGSRNGQ